MAYGSRLVPDTLRSLAFGGIGAAYTAVGSVFLHQMRLISIKNTTNQTLLITYDGTDDQDVIPAGVGIVYDLCTNRIGTMGGFLPVGTQISVKDTGVAPTSGSVYVTCFYGFGE